MKVRCARTYAHLNSLRAFNCTYIHNMYLYMCSIYVHIYKASENKILKRERLYVI